MLHYLAQHYTVDGIFFRQADWADPRTALPAGLIADSLLIDLPVHARTLAARLVRNAARWLRGTPPLIDRLGGHQDKVSRWAAGRRWDTAVIEHFWCAPYGPALRPHAGTLVLDLHNIESEWHARHIATDPWPISAAHRRFARAAHDLEARLLPAFDRVLVCSERESRLAAGAAVYPNTIPARSAPPVQKRNAIVFSGNLEYHPNRIAVKWFLEQVWRPLLRNRHPQLEWVLVGRNPENVADLLGGDARIRCTGPVDDAIPEIAAAMAAVVPLLSGSGTRIKILEAWAAGTAVVSTSLGAEGLPAGAVALADSPQAMAAAISRLLEDEAARHSLQSKGNCLFNKTFTWQAGWEVLRGLGI